MAETPTSPGAKNTVTDERPNLTVQPGDAVTDVLIVGSGPSGASAGLFLGTYGVNNIVISKYANTANTPRAHITNQRTVEIMRDMGIEDQIMNVATPHEMIGETVFCTSLAGEEFARLRSWGTEPHRHADYLTASPSMNCDIPQTRLEPVIVREAMARGTMFRWSTEFLALEQDEHEVHALVRDRITGHTYTIHARYMIGADGGRSAVAEQLNLPMEGEMGKSGSISIWCNMDLSDYTENRQSSLYWVLQPGATVGGVGLGNVRMVQPWHEWLCIWGYDANEPAPEVDAQVAEDIVRGLVGLPDLDIEVRDYSLWTVNEMYASRNTEGRVFCVGDAVHRHPPSNGLGSNTSIADSYNLAWKLAMVLKGQAGRGLLETYNDERVPVGKQIVTRANQSIGDYGAIYEALGLSPEDSPEALEQKLEARTQPGEEGETIRRKLREAMELKNYEFNAHGVELGTRYFSAAVKSDGTPEPTSDRDNELYYQATTWPGARLPHAWLVDTRNPRAKKVSTFDLCGGGKFTILTGVNGGAWVEAAKLASAELGYEIAVHQIGPGQPQDDVYDDWARQREVSDSGAVLVRPDLHVGFRAQDDSGDPTATLLETMRELTFSEGRRAASERYAETMTHW